ncbi:MAG: outer membrane lipoprotein-sorting protein [Oleiphilus sp.]|nr:MAG: outer membrane lipoprotein-sorting protein [Oleiphilus sp.]
MTLPQICRSFYIGALVSLALTPLTGNEVLAETAEEKGLAIAIEADKRDTGWQDSSANMTMTLRNKRGEESIRHLRVKSLEVENDGDKSLTIFDEPKDVRGTALLTFSHKNEPDDQWLYLPALKRVKRIASKNKSGPFMGSEFAFEDLSSQEVEKYTYKYLRDEACGELTCFVVERYPVDKNSGYTRQIAWIDQTEYRVQKVEFYDRKKSLLKTLVASDFNEYLGQYWRPGKMAMQNHQTGKSTDLDWSDYVFKSGLDEGDFTKNSLKRAR